MYIIKHIKNVNTNNAIIIFGYMQLCITPKWIVSNFLLHKTNLYWDNNEIHVTHRAYVEFNDYINSKIRDKA